MMETGIADLHTLMRFDLPTSLRLGLVLLVLACLVVLALEAIAPFASFEFADRFYAVYVSLASLALFCFSRAPLQEVINGPGLFKVTQVRLRHNE